MLTGRKLALAGAIVVGVTAYMAYLGAASSWQYYLSVDECLADPARYALQRIRVSGKVAAGSLHVADDRRHASFALEGSRGRLSVICSGPAPDNLAERIDVVVEGRLDQSGAIRGDKVLTRCASKYRSRDAAETAPERASAETEKGA